MTDFAKLAAWIAENAPDCGDNSCLFGGESKGGMRTNGRCRCFGELPTAKRIFVERLYSALRLATAEKGKPSDFAKLAEERADHLASQRNLIALKCGAETGWIVDQAIAALRLAGGNMRHYFEVIEYDKNMNCHVCLDSDGKKHRIDLMVNGDFPQGTEPEELIGKRVSCDYTYPCVSIGMGVAFES